MKNVLLIYCLLSVFTASSQSRLNFIPFTPLPQPLKINIHLSERHPTKNPVQIGNKESLLPYDNIPEEQLADNQVLNTLLDQLHQLGQDTTISDSSTICSLFSQEDKITYKVLFKRNIFYETLGREISWPSKNIKNWKESTTIQSIIAKHKKDNWSAQAAIFANKKYIVLQFNHSTIGNSLYMNTTLYFLERTTIK